MIVLAFGKPILGNHAERTFAPPNLARQPSPAPDTQFEKVWIFPAKRRRPLIAMAILRLCSSRVDQRDGIMKRVTRDRRLTPAEAAKYKAVRAESEAEKPEINARIR